MSTFSTVKKAAKLAVYDEIMIRVKNHHTPPTSLVDSALGFISEPENKIFDYFIILFSLKEGFKFFFNLYCSLNLALFLNNFT